MIYEVRMTIVFTFKEGTPVRSGYDRSKTTLIDYVNAKDVADAYIKAARNKLGIAIDIIKEMQNAKRWGGTIENTSISLDAIVAKPDLQLWQSLKAWKKVLVKKASTHKICQNCGKTIGPKGGSHHCRECLNKM